MGLTDKEIRIIFQWISFGIMWWLGLIAVLCDAIYPAIYATIHCIWAVSYIFAYLLEDYPIGMKILIWTISIILCLIPIGIYCIFRIS